MNNPVATEYPAPLLPSIFRCGILDGLPRHVARGISPAVLVHGEEP